MQDPLFSSAIFCWHTLTLLLFFKLRYFINVHETKLNKASNNKKTDGYHFIGFFGRSLTLIHMKRIQSWGTYFSGSHYVLCRAVEHRNLGTKNFGEYRNDSCQASLHFKNAKTSPQISGKKEIKLGRQVNRELSWNMWLLVIINLGHIDSR